VVGCGTDPAPPAAKPDPVTLTVPPRPGVDYVAIVGDSFTAGSDEGGTAKAGWPYLVYTQLKDQRIFMDARVDAMSTSGWVESSRQDARSFAEHLNAATGANDRLVVLFGARDVDAGVPAEELAAAVQRTVAKAKEKAPKATILIIGPAWTAWEDDGPGAEALLVRDTLKAQAEAAGAMFVDPIAEQWFADQPDLMGPDGVNPTDEGHVYMADKIAPLIAHLLPPSPGP
jgi:lysophospholipase L1-like esterase